MIVIDVGCSRHQQHFSIERLLEEFKPEALYGFDPTWQASMFQPGDELTAHVMVSNEAAWVFDGTVEFVEDGVLSRIEGGPETLQRVPCFDLAKFIRDLPSEQPIVLKVDAEGAEYAILNHLIATRTDELLQLVLVEWHESGVPDPATNRRMIEEEIACELKEWRW